MGSDWFWELRVPVAAEPAFREFFILAAERDLCPQRPDGLINLFNDSKVGLRTAEDVDVALAAMATGTEHGQLWATNEAEILVSWVDGSLVWALDSAYCQRRPTPAADAFRELHALLTDL